MLLLTQNHRYNIMHLSAAVPNKLFLAGSGASVGNNARGWRKGSGGAAAGRGRAAPAQRPERPRRGSRAARCAGAERKWFEMTELTSPHGSL